mmetsp:Transcript_67853/g.186087  ORF Transcript_67853/g.186087 Transcript_67853/m.186087 type:complete len:208 (-) Transcript_67853:602-1225(-)
MPSSRANDSVRISMSSRTLMVHLLSGSKRSVQLEWRVTPDWWLARQILAPSWLRTPKMHAAKPRVQYGLQRLLQSEVATPKNARRTSSSGSTTRTFHSCCPAVIADVPSAASHECLVCRTKVISPAGPSVVDMLSSKHCHVIADRKGLRAFCGVPPGQSDINESMRISLASTFAIRGHARTVCLMNSADMQPNRTWRSSERTSTSSC